MRWFVLIGVLTITGCYSEPDIDNPKDFVIKSISFKYPGNWYEGKHGTDQSIGFSWTNIKSPDNAVFGIQHYSQSYDFPIDEFADKFVVNLAKKLDESILEFEMVSRREPTKLLLMGKEIEGVLIEYKNKILNIIIEHRTIFFKYDTEEGTCVFVATTNLPDWDKEVKGFNFIIETLTIQ